MSEFMRVVQEKRRMCNSFICTNCPPHNKEKECTALSVNERTDKEMKELESIVMAWAAEHPEPVYETWGEWLIKQGVISGLAPGRAFDANGGLKQRIPKDIAERLGIQPEEGQYE